MPLRTTWHETRTADTGSSKCDCNHNCGCTSSTRGQIARLHPDRLCVHAAYASCIVLQCGDTVSWRSTEQHTLFYPPPFCRSGVCLRAEHIVCLLLAAGPTSNRISERQRWLLQLVHSTILPDLSPLANQHDRVKRVILIVRGHASPARNSGSPSTSCPTHET